MNNIFYEINETGIKQLHNELTQILVITNIYNFAYSNYYKILLL